MVKKYLLVIIQLVILVSMNACSIVGNYTYQTPTVEDGSSDVHSKYSLPVKSLMKTVDAQITRQEYVSAIATIERAMRIEARNPSLWQKMASVRLQQGLFDQAESLAMKTSGFAMGNNEILARNWYIIYQARKGKGDSKGAEIALKESRKLGFRK